MWLLLNLVKSGYCRLLKQSKKRAATSWLWSNFLILHILSTHCPSKHQVLAVILYSAAVLLIPSFPLFTLSSAEENLHQGLSYNESVWTPPRPLCWMCLVASPCSLFTSYSNTADNRKPERGRMSRWQYHLLNKSTWFDITPSGAKRCDISQSV